MIAINIKDWDEKSATGKLSLAMVQTIIATNWLAAYKQYVLHQ